MGKGNTFPEEFGRFENAGVIIKYQPELHALLHAKSLKITTCLHGGNPDNG